MEIQWAAVGILVAISAAFLLRRAWKTWSAKSGCGGGCGCKTTPKPEGMLTLIPVDQLRLRSQNRPAGE